MLARSLLLLVLIVMTALPAEARRRDRSSGSGVVPDGWSLQQAEEGWQGQRYRSPGGQAWVAVYSSPADDKAPIQHLRSVSFVEGEDVTFLRRERDSLTVSGFKAERLFFRRVLLGCEGRQWHHVAFEYPASAREDFDRHTSRAVRDFDRAILRDCSGRSGRSRRESL